MCRRVPRPFLLYVTQQKHAETWEQILREDGMKRVRHVHGGSGDRAGVLRLWRENRIDAVVAPSAFGLGMDKRDVRAVIHACVPETVDRFYQEVGRGGRDGRACVSIVVHTDLNLREADGLNRERVITTELGLQRWAAMFATRPKGGEREDVFAVDLRAKRPGQTQDNDANVGWNLQTLNLMARGWLAPVARRAAARVGARDGGDRRVVRGAGRSRVRTVLRHRARPTAWRVRPPKPGRVGRARPTGA